MKRYKILETIKTLRSWYYQGKALSDVEQLINPERPFLYNLFTENGIIDGGGRPVIGADFEDCLATLLFYVALRGNFKVEGLPGQRN